LYCGTILAPKSVYFNKSLLKTHSLQDEFL